jgi:hypothetical protein
MSDKPDNIVNIFPYIEDDLMDRAWAAMRAKSQREKAERWEDYDDGGTIFVNDEGKEVGFLMPVRAFEEE